VSFFVTVLPILCDRPSLLNRRYVLGRVFQASMKWLWSAKHVQGGRHGKIPSMVMCPALHVRFVVAKKKMEKIAPVLHPMTDLPHCGKSELTVINHFLCIL